MTTTPPPPPQRTPSGRQSQRPPDLLYSQDETDLRSSVRDLLTRRCDPASVLARVESEQPYDLDLWRGLAEIGAAGLAVPEKLGGAGASARETALVLEELGRSVAPVPFLGSAVLATAALSELDGDGVAELLPRLASGETIGALAVPLSANPGGAFPDAVRVDGSGAVSGRVTSVADASVAGVLVVPATSDDGPVLVAVETDADGVKVSEATSLDLTRRIADVELSGAQGRTLASGEQAEAALRRALFTGAGLLASEQLGVAEWCLDETVRYTKERFQFGRPVGSFQALKHRMADVWLELVSARAAARYAADVLANSPREVELAAAIAQSYCADVAVHAAEECVQLHGGIGMTWEHPAHLYLKRAKADQVALGTPSAHRRTVGDLVDLPE